MTVTPLAWDTDAVPRRTSRTPGPDEWAAQRVRDERERNGWSQGELARRVTEAGVPMQQQAVWKIENGDPPRKISYSEAIALCRVFDLDLDELGEAPDKYAADTMHEAFRMLRSWESEWYSLRDQLGFISHRMETDPGVYGPVLDAFREVLERMEHDVAEIRAWLDRESS
jgi:transcriptional regulator with XRE-family HTH domain